MATVGRLDRQWVALRAQRPRWALPTRGVVFLILALGGGCSAAWIAHASVPTVWRDARAFNWWLAAPAVALTGANVGLRFLRWQFLLRRAGVRLPVRQSAGIFVAGLAMLLTPAYAGEAIKTLLVARAGAPARRAGGVVVLERLLDGAALALIAGATLTIAGDTLWGWGLLLGGACGVGAALSVGLIAARVRGNETGRRVAATVALAVIVSVVAWCAGTSTLVVVCAGLACHAGAPALAGTYAVATLLGGLTLLPAGVGVVGTAILLRLQGYGVAEQTAVLAAILVRLFTVWLTAGVGVVGCWRLARRGGALARGGVAERDRFDALAPEYAEQLSPAARERVVGRKVALMEATLERHGICAGARLLDAGCGAGWYQQPLTDAGFAVTGVDHSIGQLREARAALNDGGDAAPRLAAGSMLGLPFATGAFDAAYAINALHHVGARGGQEAALAELARVVRPGGLIFVHEISTVNPLHRLYMSYVFPLLRRIDLGTEHWLDPHEPPQAAGLAVSSIAYYTFLPDFTPRWLYGVLAPIERRLEGSSFSGYSAHFTVTYERFDDQLRRAEVVTSAPMHSERVPERVAVA